MDYFGDLERDYLKDYAYICAQKEVEEWWEYEEFMKQNRKPAKIVVLTEIKDEDRAVTGEV